MVPAAFAIVMNKNTVCNCAPKAREILVLFSYILKQNTIIITTNCAPKAHNFVGEKMAKCSKIGPKPGKCGGAHRKPLKCGGGNAGARI